MNLPKILIVAGFLLIILGTLFYLAPGFYNWFGKLPGDIRIEKENSKIFIPVTSMIIISILLTILFNVAGWLFSKFK